MAKEDVTIIRWLRNRQAGAYNPAKGGNNMSPHNTYVFCSGGEEFFYSTADVHQAVEMFLEEATDEEKGNYQVFSLTPGHNWSPLRHPQRPELGY